MADKVVADCSTGTVTVAPLDKAETKQRKADETAAGELAGQALRAERDRRLATSDWTQLPDAKLDASAAAAWQRYRQRLRDLPDKTDDPADPSWPKPPG